MDIRDILTLTQDELQSYVYEQLINAGYNKNNIINTDNYVYAEGDLPVLLIAHLDTVHKEVPKIIAYDKEQEILWSPQGIGGDDRCGVYAILKIIKEFKPYVLFPRDEEIGGIGSSKFVEEIPTMPVNFMIEIDRRGKGQAVYYRCGNEAFKDFFTSIGFEENYGTFSDISILSPAYDIASVNLSAGYYNEHTITEYINLNDLEYTVIRVEAILQAMKYKKNREELKFDYQEEKYVYPYTSYNRGSYTNYELYDDEDGLFYDWKYLTDADWFYAYGYKKPKKYRDVKKFY